MDNILRGNVFHITQSQVLIGRNGLCHHISLNKGIESKEPTCYGKFWKRHPSLPLMFVYPNSDWTARLLTPLALEGDG